LVFNVAFLQPGNYGALSNDNVAATYPSYKPALSCLGKDTRIYGLVLLLASVHILTITSDVSRFAPLKYGFDPLILGVFSTAYKKFFYKYFGPKFVYEVDEINVISDTYTIYLKTSSIAMSYYPGQYIFASFDKLGPESHPYSIAGTGADGKVRLSIKVLGDYTLKLRKLAVGDKAVLFGPYGNFYESLLGSKDLVFVAGGIGITPFLGMIEMAKKTNRQKIDLVYCTKNESEMIFGDEITRLIGNSQNISFHKFCSEEKGHISAEDILRLTGREDSGISTAWFSLIKLPHREYTLYSFVQKSNHFKILEN
jgi:predicted ferric reductase